MGGGEKEVGGEAGKINAFCASSICENEFVWQTEMRYAKLIDLTI